MEIKCIDDEQSIANIVLQVIADRKVVDEKAILVKDEL